MKTPHLRFALLLCLLAVALPGFAEVVTTAADELNPVGTLGNGVSLREAMRDAPDGTAITFDPAVFNGEPADSITLALGSLELAGKQVTIDASNIPGGVTVSGNNAFQVFHIFSDASVTIHDLTITAGRASEGGGILTNGTATLNRCRIVNNSATAQGGGFQNNSVGPPASLTLNDCTIAGNTAPFGGGGLNASEGTGHQSTLVLARCTVSGNQATTDGGGLENYASAGQCALTVVQCTLAGNTAASVGGGLINFSNGGAATTQVRQSTVTGNSAVLGRGIRNNSIGTSFTLFNSIVAANPVPGQQDVYGPATSAGGNLIGNSVNLAMAPASGDQIGTGGAPIDPLLAPLSGYGGPTQTMALLPGSSAREAGQSAVFLTDQRGFPIVGAPDIGAYETGTLSNYNAWSFEMLPAGANHAFAADFENDGNTHGMEYALRYDPLANDSLLLPTLTPDGSSHVFQFRYRAAAHDLRYIVQRSPDLALPDGGWTEIYRYDASTGLIGATGINAVKDAGTELITITDPTAGTRLLWRVLIEKLP